MDGSLTIEAVSEAQPGAKWKSRWDWSWPAYQTWFVARSVDSAPCRGEGEAALAKYMPELLPIYQRLCEVSEADDQAARFLSGWCPPAYLGGCSIAAHAGDGDIRLVRNYDLSPDLNEGLLLRSEWNGSPVMGMVEFLWGLSDGINEKGLCVALAYGGRGTTAPGFGITHIVRYILETCGTVETAIRALRHVPSHMAYNLVLADTSGELASIEVQPGGGIRVLERPVATNHQGGSEPPDRPAFTRTRERRAYLEELIGTGIAPKDLRHSFLKEPLFQENYSAGFGTLFTIDYAVSEKAMTLLWPDRVWNISIDEFHESRQTVYYGVSDNYIEAMREFPSAWGADSDWSRESEKWIAFGKRMAERYSRNATVACQVEDHQ